MSGGGYPTRQSDLPVAYRALVTPEIGGVPVPEIVLDGETAGTDYVPHYAIATINPGDDVAAGTRLMNGYPEVHWILPGETVSFRGSAAITDVYVIGITVAAGGAALDIDTFTNMAYLIGRGDPDVEDWIAQMAHFTFDSTDEVMEVYITLSEALDTNIKILKVEGVSHA